MAKITALITSPRYDGNSSTLVSSIIDGAMGLSTNEIELIKINNCQFVKGCQACMKCKTEGKCALYDDVSGILEKIRESDALIISTPTYFDDYASQYKVLQDRMYSFLNADLTPNINPGKKLIIVVTCSGNIDHANKIAQNIESFFTKTLNFKCVGILTYSDEEFTRAAFNDSNIIDKALQLGSTLNDQPPQIAIKRICHGFPMSH